MSPITIRSVEFKNRVVMPANGILASLLGLNGPTEAIIDFYSKRASGGVGTIIVGGLPPSAFIPDEDLKHSVAPRLRMEALRRLAARMHESGTKVGVQLFHSNSYPSGEARSPFPQEWVAPSPHTEHHIPYQPMGQKMRQLTVEEIETIISRFAFGLQAGIAQIQEGIVGKGADQIVHQLLGDAAGFFNPFSGEGIRLWASKAG